ncbi:DUF4231 domain-containing protein [Saccharopolyspora erythraea]|uniref:DUF4231 domain-containing protein n=1 Tax=Saccharopolyspora erythraea TaxID=1836 RepID=UPI001BAD13BB|nr:DUF4231 domain-containing protein [Saccharopolyspora erythraea]QUG99616.1 DUF4231 domain-containing protein [Saccharopolyspora erythraea]
MKFRPPFRHHLPDVAEHGLEHAADIYAQRLRAFYDARARWHRRFYRFSGILVIAVGAGLPILTTQQFPGQDLVISIAGVTVAVSAGLRAFYRWDQSWILLRRTEIALTDAHWQWKAGLGADPVANAENTQRFLEELGSLRRQESDSFFQDLSFPGSAEASRPQQ